MTHQMQSNELGEAVQLLADNGFEGMANAMQILFNEAMRLERTEYIGAEPYERTDQRRSYANGYKAKAVNSQLGKTFRFSCVASSLACGHRGHYFAACRLSLNATELPYIRKIGPHQIKRQL